MSNLVYPTHEARAIADQLQRVHETIRASKGTMPAALLRVCVIRLRQISQEIEAELLTRTERIPTREELRREL